jgi:hypothetical protein
MNEEELARIVGKHESPGAGIYAQGASVPANLIGGGVTSHPRNRERVP